MYNEIYDTGLNATGQLIYFGGYGIHNNNNNTYGTEAT